MARVYSSRIMLDPSVLQNMNNVAQQRYQNEAARRESVLSPMRDLLNSAGSTFDTWLERKEREWELSDSENNDSQSNIKKMAENLGIDLSSATKDGDNTVINLNDDIKSKIQSYSNFIPEEYKKYIDLENNRITIPTKMLEGSNNSYMKDPIYRAARNEYIRTGNSQPLMSYQMQKLAAEERVRSAAKAEADKEFQKALHDAVTLREDRNKYGQLQANMFKAMDAGNMADAQTYKNQMEGLEQHYAKFYPNYSNPFGDTAQSMWDARAEQKRLADEKAAEANRLERMGQNIEKEFADNSYNQRIWFETNVLPGLKNVRDKAQAKEQVERIAKNLTDEDRKALHDKIDATETLGEKKKKSVEGAIANKAGDATGAAIDEAKNKEMAQVYVGQKMSALEFDALDDNIQKYLDRNAKGIVEMR